MAVEIGINSGFVAVAPSADPSGGQAPVDGYTNVTKDTSPAGATKITKILWWCENETEAADWKAVLYAADGSIVPGEAGTRLYVSDAQPKGTTSGWKEMSVDWAISGSTDYWIGMYLTDTATNTATNAGFSEGFGRDSRGVNCLDPLGGGALDDIDGMLTICALYEVGGPAITSISDETIKDGQTGVVISGTDFSASGNTVHLNTAADGNGTDVEQVITAEAADEITFTVDSGSFAPGATLYVIVEDADINLSNGQEVTLVSDPVSPVYSDTITGASYDSDTGIITSNGNFGDYTGRFAFVVEGAAGAWISDIFEILDSDVDSIMIGDGLGDNTDVDVYILPATGSRFSGGINRGLIN